MLTDRAYTRGAALVSTNWVFALIVLLVVTIGLLVVQMNEKGTVMQARDTAQSDLATKTKELDDANATLKGLAGVVGYNNPDNPASTPSAEAIKQNIQRLQADVSDFGGDVSNLQRAMDRMADLYSQSQQALTAKEGDRRQLEDELNQAKTAQAQIAADKETVIQDLRGQLKDASDRAQSEKDNLEQQVASLRDSNRDLDNRNRDLQLEKEKSEFEALKQITLLQARVQEFQRKYAIGKEPEAPTGHVLAVSEKLDLAYIDLGRKNRLRRGMRFEVVPAGITDTKNIKGLVEVTEIHPEFASVKIVDEADRFYPITEGDYLMNPFYDPKGEKRAVLLGRFSGRFSRASLTTLLKDVGITVQDKVDVTTDYLILGYEEIVDGEAVPFEQNAELKKAETLGVDIFPLRRIENFFAY